MTNSVVIFLINWNPIQIKIRFNCFLLQGCKFRLKCELVYHFRVARKLPGQRTTHVAPLTTHAQTRWKCQVSKATALTEQWVLFLSQLQPPTMLPFSLFPILSLPLLSCFLLLSLRALCLRAYWVPKLSGNIRRPPTGAAGYFAKATSAECVCTCSACVCVCV